MTPHLLINQIRSFCTAHASAENRIKYSRYFKDGLYNGYGLSAPQMYAEAKELLKMPEMSLQLALDAAGLVIREGKYDEITILVLSIKDMHKQFTVNTLNRINQWYTFGIHNWAHADMLAMFILPAFLRKNIISIHDLESWLHADNKFQRRSVPVTLIKSLKTADSFTDLFVFIECLMIDPDREVHQGVGWFLREAWKRHPEETERFLLKWKEVAPRLIVQYATEKMTAEGKKRFRRVKRTQSKEQRVKSKACLPAGRSKE